MGAMGRAYRMSVGKTGSKRPLGIPRRRCEDNIRIDLTETVCQDVHRFHPVQDRSKCRALIIRSKESSGSIKGG
jgi:hypothetical protein